MTLACRGGWRWNEGVRGTLSGRYGYSAHISFGSCRADNISLLIISSYPHRIAAGCGPTDHIPSVLPSVRPPLPHLIFARPPCNPIRPFIIVFFCAIFWLSLYTSLQVSKLGCGYGMSCISLSSPGLSAVTGS